MAQRGEIGQNASDGKILTVAESIKSTTLLFPDKLGEGVEI